MIHRARDLAPDQRSAIEACLANSVDQDEATSIRTVPDWLRLFWKSAKHLNVDKLLAE